MKLGRKLALVLSAIMMIGMLAVVGNAEEGGAFLAELSGTYDELFPVMCAEENDELWLEICTGHAGDAETGAAYAELFKWYCVGEIYGEQAVEAYAADPDSARFNCYFLHGIAQFIIDGNQITGTDENGDIVFSHMYSYIGDEENGGYPLYMSDDADSGEFTYFMFLPDTPAETFHIEFRYGASLEGIGEYTEGAYAYWLAAGIPADSSEEFVTAVIDLFCMENIVETEE